MAFPPVGNRISEVILSPARKAVAGKKNSPRERAVPSPPLRCRHSQGKSLKATFRKGKLRLLKSNAISP
jgi:hypothetical protein